MRERPLTAISDASRTAMAVSPGSERTNLRRSLPAPSDNNRDGIDRPQRKLYGRHKGPKLSAHQALLVATLLPQLKLEPRNKADPAEYFGAKIDDVWLE